MGSGIFHVLFIGLVLFGSAAFAGSRQSDRGAWGGDVDVAAQAEHGESGSVERETSTSETANSEEESRLERLASAINGKNEQIDRTIAALRDPSTSAADKRRGMEALLQLFQEQGGDPKEIVSIRETIRQTKNETIRETKRVPSRSPRQLETSAALPSRLGEFEFESNEGMPVGDPPTRPVGYYAADLKNAVPGLPEEGSAAGRGAKSVAKADSGLLAKGAAIVPELKRISSSLIRDLASTMQSQSRMRRGWLHSGGGPALASARRHLSSVSPTISAAVFPGDPDSPSPVPALVALVALTGSAWLFWQRSRRRHPPRRTA